MAQEQGLAREQAQARLARGRRRAGGTRVWQSALSSTSWSSACRMTPSKTMVQLRATTAHHGSRCVQLLLLVRSAVVTSLANPHVSLALLFSSILQVYDGRKPSTTVTRLDPGTSYKFRVVPVNGDGVRGAPGPPTVVTTALETPPAPRLAAPLTVKG